MNEYSSTRSREQLREQIIDLAITAFRAKGIKSVTMDDIARRLVMSKRTLYQIFADKENLLMACVIKQTEEADRRLEAVIERSENVLDVILYALEMRMNDLRDVKPAFFQEVKKYPRVIDYFRKKREESHDLTVQFLDRGKEQGIFRDDVDFSIVIHAINIIVEETFRAEEFLNVDPIRVFENTTIVSLRGCATKRGVEIIDRFQATHSAQASNIQ